MKYSKKQLIERLKEIIEDFEESETKVFQALTEISKHDSAYYEMKIEELINERGTKEVEAIKRYFNIISRKIQLIDEDDIE